MSRYVALIDGMGSAGAADLMGWAEGVFSSEGVFAIGGELQVTQSDTPAMSVEVQDGQCLVLRDAYVDNDNTQKFWQVIVTAAEDVTIDSNSSGSTRIDRICVKIDTAAVPDDNASNVATLVAVKGTPGGGAPTVPDNYLLLAQVSVEDSETQILNADITDERTYLSVGVPELDITAATGNITVAGADPWRTIELPAGSWTPTTTSGCAAAATTEAATNDIDYKTIDFDTSSDEFAFANLRMPDSWDAGIIQYRYVWTTASGSAAETLAMTLGGRSFANDDAIDQAIGTLVTVSDTWIADGDIHYSAWSGDVTLAGTPAAGEWIHLELGRDVSADDLGGDAQIIGVQIRYKQAQFTD